MSSVSIELEVTILLLETADILSIDENTNLTCPSPSKACVSVLPAPIECSVLQTDKDCANLLHEPEVEDCGVMSGLFEDALDFPPPLVLIPTYSANLTPQCYVVPSKDPPLSILSNDVVSDRDDLKENYVFSNHTLIEKLVVVLSCCLLIISAVDMLFTHFIEDCPPSLKK